MRINILAALTLITFAVTADAIVADTVNDKRCATLLDAAKPKLGEEITPAALLKRSELAFRACSEPATALALRAAAHHQYASQLASHSRPAAKAAYESGIATVQAAAGDDSPLLIPLLDSLGTLEVELDDRQRGLFLLERALSIRRQAFGAKSGDVAWGLILLGNYYMRTEQPAQAEMKFREAWEISRTAGCGPECNRATPLTALADLLRQQGRQEEADAVVAQLDAELDKDARARRAKK